MTAGGGSRPLLEVDSVVKTFPAPGGGRTRAVDGVSLSIERATTVGLVGESGSGKSTLSRCVLGLQRPDSGTIRFDGVDIGTLPARELRRLRSRIQVVFQDPHGSLNRRQTVRDIIAAPMLAHRAGDRAKRAARVRELLDLVQLPQRMGERRPRELSGGQAQRVAIARALALRPEFVVLDEAVSALDVSVRAQILNLLKELQHELGLTYLFISHDLGVVRYMAHQVAVMYHGELVEHATREELFSAPRHEYTRILLEAVPVTDPARQRDRIRRLSSATTEETSP
ncbi:ATP-binding cassette domain-containing protein [Actinocrispum wychmicini]|uniref:Peptide/nickel transport system ATP-binding protein n=1 Tax=Actinocrispum wychmicini TaxID=1213861 RepID=A0A4R2J981_9PSEU|nr:ATP-binding cassette domain-containing protein [Actinocrispum wychmicini]TCO55863.1 peptide/nickel transport system ATP-binding protein [Actinocrispum wychmicini]